MNSQETQVTTERQPRPQLPGFWSFCWMFWMQPILLHMRLFLCGIDQPYASSIRLWCIDDQYRAVRRVYVTRLAAMLFLGTTFVSFSLAWILSIFGANVDYGRVAFGVAVGVAVGVTFRIGYGVVLGVLVGVAAGAGGAAGGFVVGVVGGIASGVAVRVANLFFPDDRSVVHIVMGGQMFGVAIGLAFSVVTGVAVIGPAFSNVAAAVAFLVTFWIAFGAAGGHVGALAAAAEYGIVAEDGILRVSIFPLEIIASLGARIAARLFGGSPLRFSPVNWHDLCYFPLPGLRQQILDEAARDPVLVRQTLQACGRSPGQSKIGEEVLSVLKAREWKRLIQTRDFENAGGICGEWLGGERESDARLQSLAEASRFLRAADVAVVTRHRVHQVEHAQQLLQSLRNRLLTDRSRETAEFQRALEAAESVATAMLVETKLLAAGQLPNPYRAGEPLTPEFDQTIFRGREDLVRQIELLLNDERQPAAVSLIAPRRCGKSSLLRMLPVKLPDALCVFFDLQDNPIQAPLDLFPALDKRLREQVRRQDRESMPRLKDASLEAARDWIEALEQRPGRDRVLFCLDEFERLEEVVGEKPETKQQLVQLMGLMRATIQHRRRVRLLVSGNSTFEELGPLWNDSFISARELRLGPLARDVAIGLLRQPIPVEEGFPDDAFPLNVAEAIVDRTGGQPYLTQLYGFWLVEELNKTKRKQAELKDVEAVDQIVFEQAAPFFRDSLNPRGATFAVKPVIEQIVAGQTPDLTGPQSRFLTRRGLITPEGTLAFPILARWLNEYAE